jgi:hypothetical protein
MNHHCHVLFNAKFIRHNDDGVTVSGGGITVPTEGALTQG